MNAAGPAVALLLAALPGCGTNLLVVRHDAELRTFDDRVIPVRIDYRTELGLWHGGDHPVMTAVIGILFEPVDFFYSTGVAIVAITDDEWSVAGGPLGWLWALTPFATLVPEWELPPDSFARVDEALLLRLQSSDPDERRDAARMAFGDDRIRSFEFL
jgi:hypothetical protein